MPNPLELLKYITDMRWWPKIIKVQNYIMFIHGTCLQDRHSWLPETDNVSCIAICRVFCSLTCSWITWNQVLLGGPILNMSVKGQQSLMILTCVILATSEKQRVVAQSRTDICYSMCHIDTARPPPGRKFRTFLTAIGKTLFTGVVLSQKLCETGL